MIVAMKKLGLGGLIPMVWLSVLIVGFPTPLCTMTLLPEAIELAKEYWSEKHDRVFPAIHSFFSPSRDESYCGATQDQ